jgi:pyruvate/2-oxoglutarate dehydrogenase complex dihydrolipoamide dehydrogenase (E3) component
MAQENTQQARAARQEIRPEIRPEIRQEIRPDICVIGAGAGGLAAAAAAAAFGVNVVLIEKAGMGGESLGGALPSSALIAAAERANAFLNGASG